MKKFTKIGALVLAMMMILAMSVPAFAAGTTSDSHVDGEWGYFSDVSGTTGGDDPAAQSGEIFNLQKQLKVFNVDEPKVYAPTISFTYTIESVDPAGATVTDGAIKHKLNKTVTMPVKAGVGTFTDVTVGWTTSDELNASSTGTLNSKDVAIDFSGVNFGAPGIYRYKITEKINGETDATAIANAYKAAGVTPVNTGSQVRYFDVYVRASDSYTGSAGAADWEVYGFTCFKTNENAITNTAKSSKTLGFAATDADCYYTFNVTISKTLTGDPFSNSHEFPIHVDFTNSTVTGNILLKATVTGTATDFAHTAGAVSGFDELAKIANGGSIKYIGIPCGTSVSAYETNDVSGVTYTTVVTTDGTAGTAQSTNWITSAVTAYTAYSDQTYNSTLGTVNTIADANDNATGKHTIAFSNDFLEISPTGVVLRVAPFVGILGAGISLLLIAKRFKKDEDEDEDAVLETIPQHN